MFATELAYSREVNLIVSQYLMTSNEFVLRRHQNCCHCKRAAWWYWTRPGRTCSWWSNLVSNVVPAEEWKENFHMSRCTLCMFQVLCDHLRPFLERQSTVMREHCTTWLTKEDGQFIWIVLFFSGDNYKESVWYYCGTFGVIVN